MAPPSLSHPPGGAGRAHCSLGYQDRHGHLGLPQGFSEFTPLSRTVGQPQAMAQLTWTGHSAGGAGKGSGRAPDKGDLPWRWDLCPLPELLPWTHLYPGFLLELRGNLCLDRLRGPCWHPEVSLLWPKAGSCPGSCPGAIRQTGVFRARCSPASPGLFIPLEYLMFPD